jgi:arsenical pump membrane protein
VVLLTPVVHETATRMRLRARPHVYACTHLANSASLLLPVSNLTNLLAFSVTGLSLAGFTSAMALPWVVAIAVEYVVFRLFFRADLAGRAPAGDAGPAEDSGPRDRVPLFPLAVVAATLAGFTITSFRRGEPGLGGVRRRGHARGARPGPAGDLPGRPGPRGQRPVPGLRPVVGPGRSGPGRQRARPGHRADPAAQLVPARPAGHRGDRRRDREPGQQPARGTRPAGRPHRRRPRPGPRRPDRVNIGPNLTYAGSLATLLWRRLLAERNHEPDLGEFTRLGLATVPAGLVLATTALWLALRLTGHG